MFVFTAYVSIIQQQDICAKLQIYPQLPDAPSKKQTAPSAGTVCIF